MLELARNLALLNNAVELIEEIVIVNNASSADYTTLLQFISTSTLPFRYFDSPENLGVARGRNLALEKSSAPLLILLDDDCVLQNQDSLDKLSAVFKNSLSSRPVALVSFKVLYYDTRQMQANALPHKRFDSHKELHSFETYYYAGGAHAVQRDVLNLTGNYPADFFYGMEEYDLSYRILDAGYSIIYDDAVVMLHKESPLGRKPKEEKIRMMWVNKSKVAYRYLPRRYFVSTAIMWSLKYLTVTGFNVRGYFLGLNAIRKIPATVLRSPVSAGTLAYLRKVKARLSF